MKQLKVFLNNIRDKYTKSHLPVVTRTNLSYRDAQKIGILFYHTNDWNSIYLEYFLSNLKSDGKKLTILGYSDKPMFASYHFDYQSFSLQDVSQLGKIKSEAVNEFIQTEFDYLMYVGLDTFPFLGQILQASRAKCRVAKYFAEHTEHLDLMIDSIQDGGEADLFQQILHYIKMFKH
ncbi:MAG: hypothetical protein MUE85_20435 [Microscillaceae bacterium]|jgi:hypothetical protein|nr:hypothetical protein [Microscillaceae bacterium]